MCRDGLGPLQSTDPLPCGRGLLLPQERSGLILHPSPQSQLIKQTWTPDSSQSDGWAA